MDFCKLILCPENSTNLLINSSSFLVASLGIPMYESECLLLSCVWFFVTPRTAVCQASLSFTICWNFLKLMPLTWWCHQTTPSSVTPFSSCWGSFPLCLLSGELLSWMHIEFVLAFSVSIEMITWFLFFILLIWCITYIDLHILKDYCIPGINPTWSSFMIFLKCWFRFTSILLRIFASMLISHIGL